MKFSSVILLIASLVASSNAEVGSMCLLNDNCCVLLLLRPSHDGSCGYGLWLCWRRRAIPFGCSSIPVLFGVLHLRLLCSRRRPPSTVAVAERILLERSSLVTALLSQILLPTYIFLLSISSRSCHRILAALIPSKERTSSSRTTTLTNVARSGKNCPK